MRRVSRSRLHRTTAVLLAWTFSATSAWSAAPAPPRGPATPGTMVPVPSPRHLTRLPEWDAPPQAHDRNQGSGEAAAERLASELAAAVREPGEAPAHVHEINKITHDLKSMAAQFSYPMIGEVGASLCTFINEDSERAAQRLDVVAAPAARELGLDEPPATDLEAPADRAVQADDPVLVHALELLGVGRAMQADEGAAADHELRAVGSEHARLVAQFQAPVLADRDVSVAAAATIARDRLAARPQP